MAAATMSSESCRGEAPGPEVVATPDPIDMSFADSIFTGRTKFQDDKLTVMGKRHLYVVLLARGIWKQPRSTASANSGRSTGSALGAHRELANLQRSVNDLCRESPFPRFPFAGKSMPSVSLYRRGVMEVLHTFLPMFQSRQKPPAPEQESAAEAVIKRLQIEYEEHSGSLCPKMSISIAIL